MPYLSSSFGIKIIKERRVFRRTSSSSTVNEKSRVYMDLHVKTKVLKTPLFGVKLPAPSTTSYSLRLVVELQTPQYFRKFVLWHGFMEIGNSV